MKKQAFRQLLCALNCACKLRNIKDIITHRITNKIINEKRYKIMYTEHNYVT